MEINPKDFDFPECIYLHPEDYKAIRQEDLDYYEGLGILVTESYLVPQGSIVSTCRVFNQFLRQQVAPGDEFKEYRKNDYKKQV